MKKLNKERTVILIILLAVTVASLSFVAYYRGLITVNGIKVIDGVKYRKVPSYHYVESGQGTCMALSPECGICMSAHYPYEGKVIDRECYLPAN